MLNPCWAASNSSVARDAYHMGEEIGMVDPDYDPWKIVWMSSLSMLIRVCLLKGNRQRRPSDYQAKSRDTSTPMGWFSQCRFLYEPSVSGQIPSSYHVENEIKGPIYLYQKLIAPCVSETAYRSGSYFLWGQSSGLCFEREWQGQKVFGPE